jgi:hypothetical protein
MNHTYQFRAVLPEFDCMAANATIGDNKPNSSVSIGCNLKPIHHPINGSFVQLNPWLLADLGLNCSGTKCQADTPVSYPVPVPDEVKLLSAMPENAFSLDLENDSYEITQIPGFNMSDFVRGQPVCQLGVLPCPRGIFTGPQNSTDSSNFTISQPPGDISYPTQPFPDQSEL